MKLETTFSEHEGKPWLKAIGITNQVVSDEELDMLYDNSLGHYVHWRHQSPGKDKKGIIFGVCKDKEMVEFKDPKTGEDVRGIDFGFELLNLTDEHEKAIKFCKKSQEIGKPVGISVGKQKFVGKDGTVYASFPFDWSITDVPHDALTLTGDVTYMEDEDKKKLENEIATLRKDLDTATGKLEEKENRISKLTDEYETKLKDSVGEKLDTLREIFEKRVQEQTAELETEVHALKDQLEYAEKKPILIEIAEFEDNYLIDNFYKTQSLEKLGERLAELKKTKATKAAPSVESFERSRSKARKVSKNSFLEILESNDPELAKLYREGK